MVEKKLNHRQKAAIACLLVGMSQEDAARHIGINSDRVSFWVNHDPVFIDALREAQAEKLRIVVRGLGDATANAMKVVLTILNDPNSTRGNKLRAAEIILEKSLDLKDVIDFEDRLRLLEKASQEVLDEAKD